jgi:ribosomal protein L11 methylase PrmA
MVDTVRSLNLASELSKQAGENNEEILNSLPKKLSELVHNPLDFQTIQRCNEYLFGNRDKHYSSKFKHDDPRLSKFDPKWFSAKTVLDIGCGDGSLALLIAAKFTPKQIIGVDIDHRLTAKALSNIHDCINNTESIEFISNQIKEGEESKEAKNIQERILKLPKSMQIHISDAGAKNKLMADIKNSKMSQKELKNYLYSKVAFRSENYLASIDPSNDILLKSEKFDVIMCLRTTKFIHLNFGD